MIEKRIGIAYDIQPFSVQDGPGIRTTIFLKGCPLRCLWCHSPESQQFQPQLSWIGMRCIGCGNCISQCPNQAISRNPEPTKTASGKLIHQILIDRKKCIDCGSCTKKCYPNALFLSGIEYTVEEIIDKIKGDIPFYTNSGGGVTISGGEALSQAGFTYALLKALKQLDIHTAVDTCGYTDPENIKAVLPYTDLFLYDLKHMDSDTHKALTGVPHGPILENAKLIAHSGGQMQIRIPLITDHNDSDENMHATGTFCQKIKDAITMVQLLPFHDLGTAKYARIGRNDNFVVPPVPEERIAHCKDILSSYGLNVTIH